MRSREYSANRAIRAGVRLAVVATVVLLAAACVDPFAGRVSGEPMQEATGVVVIPFGGVSTRSAATVVPDVESAIATYAIRLDPATDGLEPVDVTDMTDRTAPVSIPVPEGTWVLTARGIDAQNRVVATSPPQTLIVASGATTTAAPILLVPDTTTGDGAIAVTLSWPDGAVSEVGTTLHPVTLTTLPSGGAVPNDPPAFELTEIGATWSVTGVPVGQYLLTAGLRGPGLDTSGAATTVDLGTLTIVAHVYSNLESNETIDLAGSLGRAPQDAPVINQVWPLDIDLMSGPVTAGIAEFDVEYTSTAATAEGVLLYVDGTPVSPLEDSGQTGTLWNVPIPIGKEAFVTMVAYNRFGESEASTPFSVNAPARPVASAPADGAVFPMQDVTLEWGATEGATTYEVFIQDGSGEVVPLGDVQTGTSAVVDVGVMGSGTFTWYVVAYNAQFDLDGIASESRTFTIRDAVYVAEDGLSGATGTPTDPFSSIAAAIGDAFAGEEVRVAGGTYEEQITLDKPGMVVRGGYFRSGTNLETWTHAPADATTLIQRLEGDAPVVYLDNTVTLESVTVRNFPEGGDPVNATAATVAVNSTGPKIIDSHVFGAGAGASHAAVLVQNGGSVEIIRSLVEAGTTAGGGAYAVTADGEAVVVHESILRVIGPAAVAALDTGTTTVTVHNSVLHTRGSSPLASFGLRVTPTSGQSTISVLNSTIINRSSAGANTETYGVFLDNEVFGRIDNSIMVATLGDESIAKPLDTAAGTDSADVPVRNSAFYTSSPNEEARPSYGGTGFLTDVSTGNGPDGQFTFTIAVDGENTQDPTAFGFIDGIGADEDPWNDFKLTEPSDVRLQAGGLDLSGDGIAADILGTPRSLPYSIGAYEFDTGEPPPIAAPSAEIVEVDTNVFNVIVTVGDVPPFAFLTIERTLVGADDWIPIQTYRNGDGLEPYTDDTVETGLQYRYRLLHSGPAGLTPSEFAEVSVGN